MASTHSAAIAVAAARLIVEEGMEYGAAKRRAARDLGGNARNGDLPGNDEIEDEVRAYLELFRADTQPAELAELVAELRANPSRRAVLVERAAALARPRAADEIAAAMLGRLQRV